MDHALQFDRIVDGPPPIFMGPLPRTWAVVPAPVVVNMCGVFPEGPPPRHTVFAIALHDIQEAEALPARAVFEAFLDGIHVHARSAPTYWHCHAGLNRSGLALAAFLSTFPRPRSGAWAPTRHGFWIVSGTLKLGLLAADPRLSVLRLNAALKEPTR